MTRGPKAGPALIHRTQVSTAHAIPGAMVGVGAARRVSAVRWNVASSIVYAWVITIPASAIVAALSWWAVQIFR